MAGRGGGGGGGGGGIHGGFISGLGPLGSAGLLGSGGMASRLGSGGLLGGGGRPPTLRWTTTNEGKRTQLGVEGHHGGGEMHEVAAMTGELGGIGPSPSRGELPIVGGTEGQLSQGGGGPPRAPSPELRPKPGSGVPTVGCGNACGGCYPVLTCCLNFFCCCWRGPMGLQGRPGPRGPPRL